MSTVTVVVNVLIIVTWVRFMVHLWIVNLSEIVLFPLFLQTSGVNKYCSNDSYASCESSSLKHLRQTLIKVNENVDFL